MKNMSIGCLPGTFNIPLGRNYTISHANMCEFDRVVAFLALIFTIAGMLSRALMVIIMRTRTFKDMTISKVVCQLAFVGTLTNMISIHQFDGVRSAIGIDIRSLSEGSCKLYLWSVRTTVAVSIWMISTISTYRFVHMFFNSRILNTVFRLRNVYINFVVITLTQSILCGLHISHGGLVDGVCTINAYKGRTTTVFTALYTSTTGIIPLLTIVGFNVAVAVKLWVHKLQHRESTIPTSTVTAMLLATVVSYILLCCPLFITHGIAIHMSEHLFSSKIKPLYITGQIALLLTRLYGTVDLACNATFCPSFRHELKTMLCSKRRTAAVEPERRS